jgi:hypothetical protein
VCSCFIFKTWNMGKFHLIFTQCRFSIYTSGITKLYFIYCRFIRLQDVIRGCIWEYSCYVFTLRNFANFNTLPSLRHSLFLVINKINDGRYAL